MIDYEEMILNLSTRATKVFAKNELEIIAVCIASHKDYPKFWQVWFSLEGSLRFDNDLYKKSLMENKSMLLALEDIDAWLYWQEGQVEFLKEDANNIIESIGFGD